jgi:hypothetical protein
MQGSKFKKNSYSLYKLNYKCLIITYSSVHFSASSVSIAKRTYDLCRYRCWIFSWAMSHICANYEYRSQVGATNRPENIVIRYVSVVSLSSICIQSTRRFQFSFTDFSLLYRSAFAHIFPRSQPMREFNTSTCDIMVYSCHFLLFK